MLVPRALRSLGLVSVVVGIASAQMACSSSSTTGNEGFTGSGAESAGTSTASANGGGSASTFVGTGTSSGPGAGPGVGGGSQGPLDVTPSALQTITVQAGNTTPTVHYKATVNGNPVNAGWTVDQGNIGTIPQGPSSGADFAPTGTTGGIVDVIAGYAGNNVSRQVLVKLTAKQNGADPTNPAEAQQIATDPMQLTAGGGVGGVGGEGLGVPVTDPNLLAALDSPMAEPTLTFLYPYDKTVFPRGLLAPLVQWSWATNDADAIKMELTTTSGSFTWSGTFGRPAILPTNTFIRMPVPQDVWDMATNSAGGLTPSGGPDQLTLKLTIAKGATAYGPISETFTVAPGRLAGTVYYNSYGTHLVTNSNGGSWPNGTGPQYGAGVLAIHEGATSPTVVAGTPSDESGSGCRVCHVVAANGALLIAQHGDNYAQTSSYDLLNGNAETYLAGFDSQLGWAGLTADGTMGLTNMADLAAGTGASSQLFSFSPAVMPLAATGLGEAAGDTPLQAGTPGFSPDTKHVAFDFLGGSIGGVAGNGTQLCVLDFDAATLSFTNLRVLATMTGDERAGFPSFFPTNDAVAFHNQIVHLNHRYNTWNNATAQIMWSDLKTGTAATLNALNGLEADGVTSYLPTTANHPTDTVLNYDPTVNPVVSGGYIWVVFTSRRLYGNMATNDPWTSDPRNYNATDFLETTTKKLWMAAVDLGTIQNGMIVPPAPGTDPSHPAFYLPAQELLAGNARGFWTLDPCKADGMTCTSGDQCCNGYCEPNGQGGALVCSNTPPNGNCSGTQERCTVSADCCDPTEACVNGFCSQIGPH